MPPSPAPALPPPTNPNGTTTLPALPDTPQDPTLRAVLQVPGVAFLRPGPAGLLLAAARRMGRLPTPTPPREPTPSGLRLRRSPTGEVTGAHVDVVLHRGHRALDVTRAVRSAVHASLPPSPDTPLSVTVTVTGIL
ncbi:Asp23/Gls24 family envelope stress response protein (plasmid) [Streptomyces sp. BI20]|uniref:Asp23/Gls24 family envelope stress response protein n=1 Tax=Streptomyces sp. BI20 TaxID=3403460 RepID=UPI003C725379